MISFKATTLKVVAVVGSLVLLLMVLLLAHITVEARHRLSDSGRYQVVDAGEGNQGQELHYASLPEEHSQGLAGLEEQLLAAKNSDEYLTEAQSEALRYLRHLQAPQSEMSPIEAKKDLVDLSSHWPAGGSNEMGRQGVGEEPQLSLPVNDPQDFEARLSQLTDALNHNMPNTDSRQQLLMSLLNGSDQANAEGQSLLSPVWDISLGELKEMARSASSDEDDASSSSAGIDLNEATGYIMDGAGPGAGQGASEYIDRPLDLSGHQYVQGGAGEGRQLLGPEGTYENVQVIKTDSAIPSYCDPPNPCPIGYTANDGCLEEFVNLASFSREYQAKQKCSCDNEHSLFNCASPNLTPPSTGTRGEGPNNLESRNVPESPSREDANEEEPTYSTASDKLDTLARTIQNRFGDLASVQRLIGKQQELNERQQQHEALSLAGNDDENSDYLVRSARKLSSLDMRHKVNLD